MNPLVHDKDIAFLLDVQDTAALLELEAYRGQSREMFLQYIDSARRLAREQLFPAYRTLDEEAPHLKDGGVRVHPKIGALYRAVVDLGYLSATRPAAQGGSQLPHVVAALADVHLAAANASVSSYCGLTAGAAHLLSAFGNETLKRTYMDKMYEGAWTGTMALTEPQAGSSLSDVRTRATPMEDGSYRITGSKIFISGGDHDIAENIVHLLLARIDGAPAGIKGVSLFCVPKKRVEGTALVDNDVAVAGFIHKIGWKALPSLALNYGERGECVGWLVGIPNQGIGHMFQMMNEARINVGMQGVATASAAYHESLEYARTRPQGRRIGQRDPASPQVPIIDHADVRRMLLVQKCIVEGGLCLVATAARLSDIATHGATDEDKARAQRLLDLLTPVVKTFPAERGFESCALALQIHGGYGYSSEYLPESWLRDQKLNSIHEGTTGIQGLDLLGRKVMSGGGASLMLLGEEIESAAVKQSINN